jgi:hypothetical protein
MTCRPRFLSSLVATALLSAACRDGSTGPTSSQPSPASKPSFHATNGTTECTAILPPGTYNDIEVPEGETCTINGSVILGSIRARQESILRMQHDDVGGSIVVEKPREVGIFSSTVGGHVKINDRSISGSGNVSLNTLTVHNGNIEIANIPGAVAVEESIVSKGSITVREVFTPFYMNVRFNDVQTGNIHVFKNRGTGTKAVDGNTAESIHCFMNDEPFFGGPNVASRTKGQCF